MFGVFSATPCWQELHGPNSVKLESRSSLTNPTARLDDHGFLWEKGVAQNWDICVVAIADTASLYCSKTFGHEVGAPI